MGSHLFPRIEKVSCRQCRRVLEVDSLYYKLTILMGLFAGVLLAFLANVYALPNFVVFSLFVASWVAGVTMTGTLRIRTAFPETLDRRDNKSV